MQYILSLIINLIFDEMFFPSFLVLALVFVIQLDSLFICGATAGFPLALVPIRNQNRAFQVVTLHQLLLVMN